MERRIVKFPVALDEDFIPEKLLFRDQQIKEVVGRISEIINYAYDGSPMTGSPVGDIVLLGSTGTGKTAVLKHSLGWARDVLTRNPSNVLIAFVQCMRYEKERDLWAEIARQIGIFCASNTPSTRIIEAIDQTAKHNFLIVILDEIDAFFARDTLDEKDWRHKPANHVLYILSRTSGTLLIAAANDESWDRYLDVRTQSSYLPQRISCDRYVLSELMEIARARVRLTTDEELVEPEAVEIIAEDAFRSGGDARRLIRLLRMAFEYAEQNVERPNLRVLSEDALWAAEQIDESGVVKFRDKVLPRSHDTHILVMMVCLHEVIESSKIEPYYRASFEQILNAPPTEDFKISISSDEKQYFEEWRRKTRRMLRYRTIMTILSDLVETGIILRFRARTRGNVFHYCLNEDLIGRQEAKNVLTQGCILCRYMDSFQSSSSRMFRWRRG